MEGFAGETVIEVKVAAAPVPCKVAVWGLLPALSTTVRVPTTWPVAEGVNVTLMVQVPLGAIEAGQLLAANGPVVETLVMLNAVDCEFVRTVVFAALVDPTACVENCRVVGDKETLTIPVPDKLTVWGLVLASSATVSVPVRLPALAGVNVTLMVQLPPGAIGVAQLLAVKEEEPVVILLILRGTDWLLVSVTVLGALLVLTT
jgi:hypothetical protein